MDETSASPPWRELLEDARWAPSPHNIQPWRLRAEPDGTGSVLCLPDRTLPYTDPSGSFTACGLGCFVESLVVAAASHGLKLDATLTGVQPGQQSQVFARLALKSGAGTDARLDRALLRRRRTSRLPYDGRPVAEPALRELADVAAAFGHELTASSERALVDWIVALNRETLFLDMADPGARREVGRWLRFSDAEAARCRDGFSPQALGFPGWLLRLFFRRHRLLELPVVRQLARLLYGRTMRGTRTVAWLRGPFGDAADGFLAGRMLMRLWLTATRESISLHPFGSVVTNTEANAQLQATIGEGKGTLWLVMRLGYGAEPPRSLRLEADELLVA
jgi:hypothetical protein